jgi:hypothetical protein
MRGEVKMIAVLVRVVRSRMPPIAISSPGIHSNIVRQLNSGDTRLDSPEGPSNFSNQMPPQEESFEQTGKRKHFTVKQKLEKDLRKWGWDDAVDSVESRGIKMLTLINLDMGWNFPSKIKETMSRDPTFFHGRDGMARHWTPTSSITSKKGPLRDAFVKVLHAQQSAKRK